MSRQIAVALIALAVLIGATLFADRVVAAPVAPSAQTTEQVEVNAGTWYCMPLAGDGETATLTIAAVGDETSRVRVEQFADGRSELRDATEDLEPGASTELEIDGGEQPPAVVIRWRGGPAVASWQVEADDQRIGANCAPSPAPRWLMTGAETTVGSSTRLYLFNPFSNDAVVRVAFATEEGRVNLVSSENVSVPAREVVDVGINELQPEQPNLGLIVEAEAGRVIASGIQRFGQPDLPDIELEGAEVTTDPDAPDGRTVLHATSDDDVTAGFAYAASGEQTTTWVSVLNPNRRPARLALELTAAIDGSAVDQEIVVGPESVERIELDGLSSSPNFGVTVRSVNDVSFVANVFAALTGDDKAVTSVPGVDEADAVSAQAAAPEGTGTEVAVFNPGEVPATAAVSAGGSVPGEWSALELGPGDMELLALADVDVADGSPIGVEADQPVLAAVRLSSDRNRARRLLTLPLVPANVWAGSSEALAPERNRTLKTRPVDFPAQPQR